MSKQVIVITGASSGFGALDGARALAKAGHTVYASMRETEGRNAPQVAEVAAYAKEHGVQLKAVELDVASDTSVEAGIAKVIEREGHIRRHHPQCRPHVVRPGGKPSRLSNSPSSSISTSSAPSASIAPRSPHLRKQCKGLHGLGLLLPSARGGTPPYLSPISRPRPPVSLAVSYASELTRWGIETSIIVPGAFTKGTNHFAHSGLPADKKRAAEYDNGPYAGVTDKER